ncbi:MAG: transglutaminase family protein [Pseudomonadota bacterium]
MSDELRDRLEEMTDVMADIADVAAPATDLAGTVLDTVGSDGAALVDYVGGSIAYVPYTGVLRGADGTLRSGYGNSYDQSLALITLLRRAGYEAQILVGPETEEAFATSRAALPSPINQDDMQDLLGELEELTEDLVAEGVVQAPPAIPAPDGQTFDPAVGADAAAAAVALLTPTEAAALAEDPVTYALVRYRQGPADDWAYADPAKNTVLADLDTAHYAKLSNQVPDEHLHYVELRVVVESAAFGSVPVAETRAPASNISNRPINFGFVPSGEAFGVDGIAQFDPSQDLVFGSDTFPQAVVTLNGQSIPIEEAANVMAGVFKTGAGLMGDAISSISAEDVAQAPLLDAIKLQITTIGPNRQNPRMAERIIVDRAQVEAAIGTDEREAVSSALLAAASGSVLLHSGIAPRSPAEREAGQLIALSDILEGLVETPEAREGSENVVSFASLILRDELASIMDDRDDAAHMSASLAMMQTVRLPSGEGGAVESALMTDILLDGRRAMDPRAALALAVDTAGREQDMLSRIAIALEYPPSRIGSYAALQVALANGTVPVSYDDFLAAQVTLEDADRAAQVAFLTAQRDAGMQLAIWPGATADETAWLEYDPAQGYARLASGNGAGQDTVEDVLLQVNIALYLTVINLAGCAAKASTAAPGATHNCLTCTGIKFSLALAGIATLGFGATAMLGASSMIIEASCL